MHPAVTVPLLTAAQLAGALLGPSDVHHVLCVAPVGGLARPVDHAASEVASSLLAAMSTDRDPEVRARAATRLGLYDDRRSLAILIRLVKHDPSKGVRAAAIDSLGRRGPAAAAAVPALIDAMTDVSQLSPDDERLLSAFGSDAINGTASTALIRIGKESIPALTAVAADARQRSSIRVLAMTSLTGGHLKAPDRVALFIRLTTDDAIEIRYHALAYLRDERPRSIEAKRAVLAALADPSPLIQVVAATVLRTFDENNPITLPVLMSHLGSDDPRAQWYAVSEVGKYGARATVAVPQLIAALKSPDASTRVASATALGEIGPGAKAALPLLIEAQKCPDELMRFYAASSVKKISGQPDPK